MTGDIMSALPDQANPLAILFGFSGLKDKIGQQLAPEFVSIVDNPIKEYGNVYNPFDFDSIPRFFSEIFDFFKC